MCVFRRYFKCFTPLRLQKLLIWGLKIEFFTFYLIFQCYSLNVSLKDSYAEIITPKEDSVKRWAFGRCLGHECGALVNGITALIKEAPESPLAPSMM